MNDDNKAPEQIIINGQEYTPEDAAQFVDLGKKYKDIEGKLNTSLDKVYPEYTRTTQRNKELETELAERNREFEELQKKNQAPADPDREAIKRSAREIGLVDKDLLKEQGYMTRDEIKEFMTQDKAHQQLVDNVLTSANKLEKEIDGSDGRVPFNQKAVLAYASAYNIADLATAYDEMNEGANAKWKAAQIEREARPGLTTLRGGGKKTPERTKITDDNFKEAWDELLGTE